jgi:hypothetical protein
MGRADQTADHGDLMSWFDDEPNSSCGRKINLIQGLWIDGARMDSLNADLSAAMQ